MANSIGNTQNNCSIRVKNNVTAVLEYLDPLHY